jgi:hypothetical protein
MCQCAPAGQHRRRHDICVQEYDEAAMRLIGQVVKDFEAAQDVLSYVKRLWEYKNIDCET